MSRPARIGGFHLALARGLRTLLPFVRFVPFVLLAAAALSLHSATAFAQVKVSAARVWPAADYTRITLESPAAIQHKVFSLDNPDRLVLDLEGADITSALTALSTTIGDKDPYVKSVRVGRFKPGTIRLVFDLKSTVRP